MRRCSAVRSRAWPVRRWWRRDLTYAISQGSLAANGNYSVTSFTNSNLTIQPRTITLTADAQTKMYGNNDPTLTFTVGGPNGLANNAGIGVVDSNATVFSGSLTRVAGETVVAPGPTYAISQGSLAANGNYSVTSFTNSNLTIQPRTITLTADAQTKMYGNNDPTLTFTVGGPNGLANNAGIGVVDSNATVFSGSLTRVAGETVVAPGPTYAISQGSLAANGNYSVTSFTNSNLTIQPRTITLTADAQTKMYGNNDPTLTFTVGGPNGLANNAGIGVVDSNATVFSGSLTRVAGETVVAPGPTYAISQGSLAANGNYSVTSFTNSNLTIQPRTITLTADAQTKMYGNNDPTLTFTVGGPNGLANNAGIGVVDSNATVFSGSLTRVAGETVVAPGPTYAISQGSLAANGNYSVTSFTNSNLTIQPRTITLTADAQTKMYGNNDPTLTFTVGGPNGLANNAGIGVVDSNATVFSGSLTRVAGETVVAPGPTYAISQGSLAANGNYSVTSFTNSNLTIQPRTITLTADAQTKMYGNNDPTLTFTVGGPNGLANNAGIGVVDSNATVFSGSLTRVAGETVVAPGPTYAISQGSLAANGNYSVTSFTNSNLTIQPRTITLTADAQTKMYGNNDPTLTFTVGGPNGLANNAGIGVVDSNATVFSGSLTRVAGETVVAPGPTYAISQGSLAANGNYSVTSFTNSNLTIQPRTITLTADAQTKMYGNNDPTLTFTVGGPNGLANNAGIGVVDSNATVFSGSLTRVAGETVVAPGPTYAISQGSLAANGNYSVTSFTNSNLTIQPRTITLTADAQTKMYGNNDPTLTFTVGGPNGLANNAGIGVVDSNATVFSGSLTRVAGETVVAPGPTYAISQGSLAANGNYSVTSFTNSNLTIQPRTITLTADAQTKMYGNNDPTLTFTVGGPNGLANNAGIGVVDSNATVFSGSLTRVAGETVVAPGPTYAISQGSLAANGNYSVTSFTNSNLTIQPRTITLTADAQTKMYGNNDPTLTFTVGGPNGLANNAGIGVVDSNATVFSGSLTRVAGETVVAPGPTYAISQGSLAANGNYSVTSFTNSNLTIQPRTITLTADAQTKMYGNNDPTLTFTVGGPNGLANNAGIGVVDSNATVFSGSLTRVAGETVVAPGPTYAISQGSLAANGNYSVTSFTNSNLTIQPRTITLTADAQTKMYGNNDPTLTFTVGGPNGLANNAGIGVVDSNATVFSGSLTRVAGETVVAPGPTYAISQGSLAANGNYSVTSFTNSNLTIQPRTITLTADAQTKMYGNNDPTLTFTVGGPNGLANNAGIGVVDSNATVFSGSLTRVAGETVVAPGPTYAISQGSLAANGNYSVTSFTNSNLTIQPAPLTIQADSTSRAQGVANPPFTATYSGFKFTDTPTSLTGTLSFTTPAIISSPSGFYPITPSGQTATNYAITFVNGTLTVGPIVVQPPGLNIPGPTPPFDSQTNTQAALHRLGNGNRDVWSDCLGPDRVAGIVPQAVSATAQLSCGVTSGDLNINVTPGTFVNAAQ